MPKVKLWDDLTPAEKVKRWEGVERVMKKLTPHQRKHHFYMGSWGYKDDCGTVACVAGHCGLDPSFRRQGFKMITDRWGESFDGPEPLPFFGSTGYFDVFMETSATYSQTRANISRHLKTLRANAKRS